MWKVATLINGEWKQIDAIPIENNAPPSLDSVLTAAQRFSNTPRFATYLNQERTSTSENKPAVCVHDAIERWSSEAEADSREFDWAGQGKLAALEEAIAYYGSPPEGKESLPDTLVWHDHSTVIIPVTGNSQQLLIEYTPGLRDQNRVERLQFRYGSTEHKLETIFEARGYYGTQSAVIDHWKEMRRTGGGYVTSLRSTTGFLVGRILRRSSRPKPTLKNDPTFRRRLTDMCERFSLIAQSYPDLESVPAVRDHDAAIVFVHGTVSCAIQSLKDLCANGFPVPIYRYEHDTFLAVGDNGRRLAELIANRIRAKRLLIVAHSRGGLVARVALAQLALLRYQGEIELQTFGTPHEGTPLANIGDKLVNLLFKLGSHMVGAIPVMTPAVAAYSFILDGPTLPPGIAVMQENSDTLDAMNSISDPSRVRCWGSKFDIDKGPSGFGVDVEGALMGAMGGIDHDLVVPTHSALAFGAPQCVLACSHVQYFADPVVQGAIRQFAPPAAVAVAAPAGLPHPGQIQRVGEQLWIGNVRVSGSK